MMIQITAIIAKTITTVMMPDASNDDGHEEQEKCEEVQEERQIMGMRRGRTAIQWRFFAPQKFISNLPPAAWQQKKATNYSTCILGVGLGLSAP